MKNLTLKYRRVKNELKTQNNPLSLRSEIESRIREEVEQELIQPLNTEKIEHQHTKKMKYQLEQLCNHRNFQIRQLEATNRQKDAQLEDKDIQLENYQVELQRKDIYYNYKILELTSREFENVSNKFKQDDSQSSLNSTAMSEICPKTILAIELPKISGSRVDDGEFEKFYFQKKSTEAEDDSSVISETSGNGDNLTPLHNVWNVCKSLDH